MARIIDTQNATGEVVKEHRTWATNIRSELGQPYMVDFHREEIVRLDGQAIGLGRKLGSISFTVGDHVDKQVTAAGITVTVGQLAALVAQLADNIEAEQEAATQAALEAQPEVNPNPDPQPEAP